MGYIGQKLLGKKFKKELEEEQTKLEDEVKIAVKKKLDEVKEPES